ncbi:ATP-dependent RNA helicase DHX30 [Calliopsis andreniformis]|uniref:ATP-dependent RNA helicase DHX30 n=1 Tax=Calliopsis andreniformis TaxID=337506 RepID=UPI003FCD0CCA
MILPQVTSSLQKSICRYLILHQRNPICKLGFNEIYAYPTIFHRSHTSNSDIFRNINNSAEVTVNKNEVDDFTFFKTHKCKRAFGVEKFHKNPLGDLLAIYVLVKNELKKECISFKYKNNNTVDNQQFDCTIYVTWPEKLEFSHVGPTKKAAIKHAALKCLNWLHVNKKIKDRRPTFYNKEEIKALVQQPVRINFDSKFESHIKVLIDKFDTKIKPIINVLPSNGNGDIMEQKNTNSFQLKSYSSSYCKKRNMTLANRLQSRVQQNNNLPIMNYREEIIESLKNNQVLLIKGDTGSGKSTQVPQFIMDDFTKRGKAHECNIYVSEPRKISCLSLAERIAFERGEVLGDVVGYHVRLDSVIPKICGSIIFYTSGMLLQKMRYELVTQNASHIIIDEVHERTLQTDILLNLLKKLLDTNPSLKVIIMSATINTELFQKYFSCPKIDIPGKIYPIKMHFLEDMPFFVRKSLEKSNLIEPKVPFDDVVRLINWIVKNKPPGAILCFLPGWQDIKNLQNLLEKINSTNYYILPLHSKLTNDIQKRIFEPVPDSVQKIILATDIAESSITIQDVTYVIDTAVKKDIQWNNLQSTYSITNKWISQANVYQRRGRAGRLRPGESYHFITKEMYNNLNAYPEPEIHKLSLEQVVLYCKIYSDGQIFDFFSNMIDKPNKLSIINAISSLQGLNILDKDENLTALGKRIIHFTLDPRLSRALLFSCIFQCMYPILQIGVLYSTDNEMSATSLVDKAVRRKQKSLYHETSDHIANVKYFKQLMQYQQNSFSIDKSKKNNMHMVEKIYELHINELIDCGILPSTEACENINTYTTNNELIRAILFSATNRLLKHSSYGYKNGHFSKSANRLIAEDKEKVFISTDSVNYKRKEWPSDLLTYINRISPDIKRACMISDTSMITPLSVLLFSQGEVTCGKVRQDSSDEEEVLLRIDKYENVLLSCDEKTANQLLNLRSILWDIVDYIIRYEGRSNVTNNLQLVKSYKTELVYLISQMLDELSHEMKIDNKKEYNSKSTFVNSLQ